MDMWIDEAGHDDLAVGVDSAVGLSAAQIAESADAVTRNANIRSECRPASGTINDVPIPDDTVESHG